MHSLADIQRASRRLRLALTGILVAIPIVSAVAWLFINSLPGEMQGTILPHYARLPLPVSARLLGLAASLLPGAVAMYGVIVLIRLFKLYEQGEIFRAGNVRCFQKLSRVLIIWCVANVLSGPLMSIALTLHHGHGQRLLVVGFGSPDMTALLVGLILAVIAWVMEEGRKLQDEQDYIV